MARDKVSTDILWKDRKRILFLGLPWSFTRYSVSKDRFFISKGFFSVKDDEVRLYRIMDISLERSFMQRLVGVRKPERAWRKPCISPEITALWQNGSAQT